MTPSTSVRLRIVLLTLAFVCAIALTGIVQQGPRGGHVGAVLTGVIQSGPRGLLGAAVPLTGVIVSGGVPR